MNNTTYSSPAKQPKASNFSSRPAAAGPTNTPKKPTGGQSLQITVTDGDGILLDRQSFLLLGGAVKLAIVPLSAGADDPRAIIELTIGKF